MGRPSAGYLFPFACFACRRSFKRPGGVSVQERKCPYCKGTAVKLDRKFKAPKGNDVAQWDKVEFLYRNGFPFHSIRLGGGVIAAYPETLREAKAFVRKFAHKAKWAPGR